MEKVNAKWAAQGKYRRSPRGIAARAAYRASAQGKAKAAEKRAKPEAKARMAVYLSEYQRRPNVVTSKRKWVQTWRGKANTIRVGMVAKSTRKGWGEVEWTVDEIQVVIENGRCCKTGIPFTLAEEGTPAHRRTPFAPSPDRIDNQKGYMKNNVQWVCWMYNQMKGQADDSVVNYFIREIIRFNKITLTT